MKILMTGSHFTPAQAVIEQLKKLNTEEINIIYIGRNTTMEGDKTRSVESQILPKMGVRFYPITTGRLRRYLSFGTLISLLKIPIGFVQSMIILAKERPDKVVSFGGYVAVPVVISAWLLSIPVLTHEQTLVSGLANRICALFAKKILVSFDNKYYFPKDKTVLTGNPMREELISPKKKIFPHPLVLVLGGNQGSHLINESIFSNIAALTESAYLIHQTGDSKLSDYERGIKLRTELPNPERYLIYKFISAADLGSILKEADLVITRSGANTLLELAYFGSPALFVPLPNLYQDEQGKNARYFAELGLGEILDQDKLNSNLAKRVKEMLKNTNQLKIKAKKASSVVIPDASKRVAMEIITTK